ncbi:alpha/beta-type small acid-soluble spore protein [Siminovitchia terrae]|uniref:Alpha/beta-type small acid-soluble spore protein n=1 Tax=Siminovitchia terrae TaxID=1914933 RepID=A0A429X6Z0_SIMTE|nr:alpha/beta-type small acid-soluble spore protein [Siminovitchia terrae]RST59041.1 alpha/beta-type small acid-soluble spore protein [Siminovitchia terrae]GIN92328.1 hypothetical protein J22TS1_33790 [Siminovitchia terrae]
MTRNNKILVPEARAGLDQLKARVMKDKGYRVNPEKPDNVKYEIAREQGIPLKEGNNGQLTSEQAGKIGGPIGGNMVKEMIKMAQEQMKK